MTPNGLNNQLSQFLSYLALKASEGEESLPSLSDLSDELEISVSTLREELQVAKALGLVDVKPRTGIKCLQYSFSPAVEKSLAYAVRVDRHKFRQFSDLRNHIEASYWYQAVSSLRSEDIDVLKKTIRTANQKLNADPMQIPHAEHRQLHMTIYSRLENEFVLGILESYWDIYEAVGLSVYEDRKYLERVWTYHQQMVDSIVHSDFLSGYQALIAHMDLLFQREQKNSKIPFE
ncbi:MAG: FCD domain-containing protein [Chloroflexota bacterium]|jgi:DNA-binding FadR family transcriptional regulator|nr:FCD domain-containing protein [Chloroflexota bacterium]